MLRVRGSPPHEGSSDCVLSCNRLHPDAARTYNQPYRRGRGAARGAEERGNTVRRASGLSGVLFGLLFWAGCAGDFVYVRPVHLDAPEPSVAVGKSKAEVWQQIVPMLEDRAFVIDVVDKDAGVIILSYTGDPQGYVDCGHITSYVKNLRGERTYHFPAAIASTEYEFMQWNGLRVITREMSLEGRINVTVAETGAGQTQVSARARYAVTRNLTIRDTQGRSEATSHVIHFTSSQDGAFPGTGICRATGLLEAEVLSALAR